MLQQISLTHRAVENMRMPLSTSRRSKRSCGTKNTAKPATSPACLNRNWEDEESGEESRRPVNTLAYRNDRIHSAKGASRRGWLSSLLHPSCILYSTLYSSFPSPLALPAMKTSRRLVLYSIRTVVNGRRWAGAFNAVCKHGAGRIIRKSPIGFITPSVRRSWFICRYDLGGWETRPQQNFPKYA